MYVLLGFWQKIMAIPTVSLSCPSTTAVNNSLEGDNSSSTTSSAAFTTVLLVMGVQATNGYTFYHLQLVPCISSEVLHGKKDLSRQVVGLLKPIQS